MDEKSNARGAPKKYAVVVSGRTVYTKRGVGRHPAQVTIADFLGGKEEFYKLLKQKIIQYPKALSATATAGTQLSMDTVKLVEETEGDESDDLVSIKDSELSEALESTKAATISSPGKKKTTAKHRK